MHRSAVALVGPVIFLGCTEVPPVVDASSSDGGPVADSAVDAAIDAARVIEGAPEVVFLADEAGMCPELHAPTYAGRSLGAARGSVRWDQPMTFRFEVGTAGPTFVSNASFWTTDLWAHDAIDHDRGDQESRAYQAPTVAPTVMESGSVWRYKYPPMSLGETMLVSRDAFGLWFADLGSTGPARRWAYPELDALVNRAEPLPGGDNLRLQHVMPAWSPATGQIAYPVGYDHSLIAVSCPMDRGGQFILRHAIPADTYPATGVYYRANGELLLHQNGLYVISPRGETLRAASMPSAAQPYAYQEGCGLLYREGTNYSWFDVDAMTSGATFDMTALNEVAAMPDCRLLANGEIIDSDGTRIGLAAPGEVVSQLADGRFVRIDRATSSLYIVDAAGVVTEGPLSLEASVPRAAPYWTPDGHVMFVSRDRAVFFDLDLPPPGPMLWPEAGMNWAHTNSPLPTPR